MAVGVATGFAVVELLSEEEGLQEYVPPPLEESEVFAPKQMEFDVAEALAMGSGLTVTVTVEDAVQPFASVTVTVYVVVVVGFALGLLTVEELKEDAGAHTNEVPFPLTDKAALLPRQMADGTEAALAVALLTTSVTVTVPEQPPASVMVTVYVVVVVGVATGLLMVELFSEAEGSQL